MEWLLNNIATIIVALIVIGIVAVIVADRIKKRKNGVCNCGCEGCNSSCPKCGK